MIANLNVLTENGAIIMYQLNSMLQQSYPIRFGVVPICNNDAVLASYRRKDIDNTEMSDATSLQDYFDDRDVTSACNSIGCLYDVFRIASEGERQKR